MIGAWDGESAPMWNESTTPQIKRWVRSSPSCAWQGTGRMRKWATGLGIRRGILMRLNWERRALPTECWWPRRKFLAYARRNCWPEQSVSMGSMKRSDQGRVAKSCRPSSRGNHPKGGFDDLSLPHGVQSVGNDKRSGRPSFSRCLSDPGIVALCGVPGTNPANFLEARLNEAAGAADATACIRHKRPNRFRTVVLTD